MAREKEKTNIIDTEIMLEIKREFPKLMDFYNLANLKMDTQQFYSVMRGEEGHPEAITSVELGLIKAKEINGMSVEEMCSVIENAQSLEPDRMTRKGIDVALRMIVAQLI